MVIVVCQSHFYHLGLRLPKAFNPLSECAC